MSLDVVVGSWLGSILILNPSAALLGAQPTMAAPLPGGGLYSAVNHTITGRPQLREDAWRMCG